jgi:hypothetical protein
MKNGLVHSLRMALITAALAGAGSVSALTISFTAVNLANTSPGEDLWRYQYTLNGAVSQFDVIRLSFDDLSFGTLSNGQPATSTSLQVQPLLQPAPPTDGSFALRVIGPGTVYRDRSGVSVDVVWKGAGTPGSQPFALLSQSGATVLTGSTSAVPEPSATAMMALGLILLASRRASGRVRMATATRARRP